jgi:hypothetical protein
VNWGSAAGTAAAPAAELAAPERRDPWLTRPGVVLVAVLAVWTAVPSLVAGPKLVRALTAVLLVVVANALWRHAARLRWAPPVVLLGVMLACAAVSSVHYGTLAGLASSTATAVLLVGCCLLASHADRDDATLLARGVVVLALLQLAVALASAHWNVPAPWGYEGESGTTFGTNDLLPALGGRSTGTMAHPIPFGTLLAVGAVLCLTRCTRWSVPLRLATAAACGYGVALSGSRSAALALAVALVAALLIPGVLRISPVWRTAGALALAVPLLLVNIPGLAVFTSLQGTGSLTHRLGALDVAVRLAGRPLDQVLLGSGAGSLKALFTQGLLQLDGFFAVDNQLVTTFAEAGVLGVLALVAAVLLGLRRGERDSRPAALVAVLMFASFDVLAWNATAFLATVLLVLGSARSRRVGP